MISVRIWWWHRLTEAGNNEARAEVRRKRELIDYLRAEFEYEVYLDKKVHHLNAECIQMPHGQQMTNKIHNAFQA